MGAEVNRRAQCRERNVVATRNVAQQLAARRGIARPDGKLLGNRRRNVVDHLPNLATD